MCLELGYKLQLSYNRLSVTLSQPTIGLKDQTGPNSALVMHVALVHQFYNFAHDSTITIISYLIRFCYHAFKHEILNLTLLNINNK